MMSRVLALALVGSLLAVEIRPARSNPAIVAPAVCASGVGCVLIGTAAAGFGIVYIWQNLRTGETYRMQPAPTPMPSRVFVSDENYNIPGQREVHFATTSEGCQAMLKRFRDEGRRLRLKPVVRVEGGVLCVFEGPDATTGYYNDNRSR